MDTNGKRIQAHGGSVFYKDGFYYWYGENKGLIIEPDTNDSNSPIHPSSLMDRPHILYIEKTKKFVCWLKIMDPSNSLNSQSVTILTSDEFMGSYTMIRKNYKLLGMNSGDFDLAVDDKTKEAYYYFEKVHTELICAELSDYVWLSIRFEGDMPIIDWKKEWHVLNIIIYF